MPVVPPSESPSLHRRLLWWLGLLLATRFLLMVLAPHTDPSESRYAEISRKMAETGDWITPQFDYGVPFWAKPPLSMWMSALGMEFFGVNETGSRIVIFATALGVLWLVAKMGRRDGDRTTGLAAAVLLAGMPLFYYCSAAVMTDLPLLFGTTLAMAGFRFAVRDGSKAWGHAFFLGLAAGLLAKGPLVLVIAAPPLAIWVAVTGQWRKTWRNVPWITGTLLMLAVAAPWYVLEERKTPGFLDYFLVGEHWRRFTVKGWQGDLYGNAHAVVPGMMVVFTLAGMFPWCLGLLGLRWKGWPALRKRLGENDGALCYHLAWALWPVIFFLPARNIIATYPLPALPGMALLLAFPAVIGFRERRGFHGLHPALAAVCGCMVTWAVAVSVFLPDHAPKHSERELVRQFLAERRTGDTLIYYGYRKFSAEFYAEGNVRHTGSLAELRGALDAPGRLFVVVPGRYLGLLPEDLRSHLAIVGSRGPHSLLVEVPELSREVARPSSRTFPAFHPSPLVTRP